MIILRVQWEKSIKGNFVIVYSNCLIEKTYPVLNCSQLRTKQILHLKCVYFEDVMFGMLFFNCLFNFQFLLHSSPKMIGKHLWEVYLSFHDSYCSKISIESLRSIDSF